MKRNILYILYKKVLLCVGFSFLFFFFGLFLFSLSLPPSALLMKMMLGVSTKSVLMEFLESQGLGVGRNQKGS